MRTDRESKGKLASDKSKVDKEMQRSDSMSNDKKTKKRRQPLHLQFAHIIENMNEGFIALDGQMNYLYINQRGGELLKRKPDDLVGKNYWEEYPQEKDTSFGRAYRQALQTQTPVEIEDYYAPKDRWFENRIYPSKDGLSIFFNDTTERKRAEVVMQHPVEFNQAVMSNMGEGLYTVDSNGLVTSMNSVAEKLFGWTFDELCGHKMHEVTHYKHRDGTPFPVEDCAGFQVLHNGQALTDHEDVFIRKDGTFFDVVYSSSPLWESGKINGLVVVFNDITERKQMEDALRQSEERFARFMQSLPALAWIKDLQGRYVYANDAAERAFSTPREELYGKTDQEVFPPETAAQFKKNDEEALKYETGVQVIETLEHEDGVLHYSLVNKFPIWGPDGNIALVGGTAFDITEHKRAEEQLHQLNLELEERVQKRTAQLQTSNQALDESRRRLQSLSQRLVEVQEEERRAIARELHDRVGQSLAALNLNLTIINNQLSNLVNEQVNRRLSDSIQLVAEVIALVRDVMADLRPAVLDDYGLEVALQTNLEEFKSRYGLSVMFEKTTLPIPRLGTGIEMTLLRIAQEALLNIARHAHADQSTLSLQLEEKAIRLIIGDNGIGIKSWQEANRPGSHGLMIMRERAEAVGGNLKISSMPGGGTQVEVSIPLQYANFKE